MHSVFLFRMPFTVLLLAAVLFALQALVVADEERTTEKNAAAEKCLQAYQQAYSKCEPNISPAAQWVAALAKAVDVILADPMHPQLSKWPGEERITPPLEMLDLGQRWVGRFDDMDSADYRAAQRSELQRLLDADIPEGIQKHARFSYCFLNCLDFADQMHASEESSRAFTRADCRKQADDFYRRYPDDTRYGPTLHWWPSSSTSDVKDIEATVQRLRKRYPNHRTTGIAEGRLSVVRMLGKPFSMQFADLLSGDKIDLAKNYRGKVVLIDFWATWCGPCVGKMPHIKSDLKEFGERGFAAIGVTVDEPRDDSEASIAAKRKELVEFLQKDDYLWPQFFKGVNATEDCRNEYGVTGYPTVFLLDRQGRLRWLNRSFVDSNGKLVSAMMPEKEAIKALLKEQP